MPPRGPINPEINVTGSEARISYLFSIFNEGGTDQARITHKDDVFFYVTELEDIGPMYIMDDFGNAIKLSWEMWGQHFWIYPPLAELT